MTDENLVPPHLAHAPRVLVRVGNDVQEAPATDQALARSYPQWPEKGAVRNGRRITILTTHRRVRVNQEVRIVHVAEALDPSAVLYTMGPKVILGEYLDGKIAAPLPPASDDPLQPPGLYDGPIVSGPALDYGYDVSAYWFDQPGPHRIVWRLGDLVSNELVVVAE